MSRIALRSPRRPLRLSFPTRLANYALTAAEDATGSLTSWIQIAVACAVEPRNLEITVDDLRRMAANFTSGKFPEPPTQICCDYEHLSLRSTKPGDGKAAGWIQDVALRADGAELWAQVAWTPEGAKAVADKEYQFISPVIAGDHVTNAGEHIGPTLINIALTNTPQLQGMAPVTLSRQPGADITALVTLSDYERRWRVEQALQQRFGMPDAYYENTYCYLLDLYGDVAVFRTNDDARTWSIPFAIADDGTVTLTGDRVEVTPTYSPLTAGPRTPTMKMITLMIDGKATQVPETALEATDLVQGLRAKVPADGTTVVPAEQFTALSGQVAALNSQITSLSATVTAEKARADAAEQAIKTRDAKDRVSVLMRAGKVTPAQQPWAEALALSNPEMFAQFEATAPVVVVLETETGTAGAGVTGDAHQQLAAKAAELKKLTPSLTDEQAYAAACDALPALAYTDTRAR